MSLSRPPQRTQTLGPWAEVQLSAVTKNLKIIRRKLPVGTRVAPVLIGNAYGHGLVPVARLLEGEGVDGFCVASVAEGRLLREAGIELPVYILGPSREASLDELLIYQLTPAVTSSDDAAALQNVAEQYSMSLAVHLRIDVGYANLGIPSDQFSAELEMILQMQNLEIEGIFTHFSFTDQSDSQELQQQIFRFNAALQAARELGIYPPLVHAAGSTAIFSSTPVFYDMVRPGMFLYGLPLRDRKLPASPVMSIKSRVIEVHRKMAEPSFRNPFDTRVEKQRVLASVAFGYADGMFMHFMRSGQVLVRGERVPLVGTAYMNHVVVDVTNVQGVSIGDEVVLLGRQGQERITVAELAEWSGLDIEASDAISMLSPGVPRSYLATENL